MIAGAFGPSPEGDSAYGVNGSVDPAGISMTANPGSGDYDGDGKTDYAVWRPGDGFWYIINSKDESITATQWGVGYAPYDDEPINRFYKP